MDTVRMIVFLLAMILSIIYLIYRRKKLKITGFKTLVTSLCFYSIALLNMAAYTFNFLGLVTFIATFGLLLLAAYCTKYLPRKEEQHEI